MKLIRYTLSLKTFDSGIKHRYYIIDNFTNKNFVDDILKEYDFNITLADRYVNLLNIDQKMYMNEIKAYIASTEMSPIYEKR